MRREFGNSEQSGQTWEIWNGIWLEWFGSWGQFDVWQNFVLTVPNLARTAPKILLRTARRYLQTWWKNTIPRSRHYRYSSVKKDSKGKYPLLPESMSNQGENLAISQSSLCSLSSCNHGGLHSTWLCVHAFCVNSGTCIALTSFSAQVRYDRPIVIAMKIDSKFLLPQFCVCFILFSPRWLLGPSALTAFPRCLLCFGTMVRFFFGWFHVFFRDFLFAQAKRTCTSNRPGTVSAGAACPYPHVQHRASPPGGHRFGAAAAIFKSALPWGKVFVPLPAPKPWNPVTTRIRCPTLNDAGALDGLEAWPFPCNVFVPIMFQKELWLRNFQFTDFQPSTKKAK